MVLRFVARVPKAPLAEHVELIWASEGQPEGHLEQVLPFGKAQLLVDLDGNRLHWCRGVDDRLRLSGMVVQGPMTRPLLVDPWDQRKLLGASLHGWGLAKLVAAPIGELRDQLVELTDLSTFELEPAMAQLATIGQGVGARLDGFEALLEELFASSATSIANEIKIAAARLDAEGDLGVRALAKELGLSQRRLSERFSAVLGMRPKTWQRIRRFRKGLALLEAGCTATEVAHRLGYTDQPHFNHDFRSLCGRSPLHYLRSPRAYEGHLVLDRSATSYKPEGRGSSKLTP